MKRIIHFLFIIPVCIISMFTMIYIFSQEEPLFHIRNLKVNGIQQLKEAEVIKRISPLLVGNIFRLDAEKVREAIVSHPYVKDVRIKRVYPFSVLVDVVEKKPSALWVDGHGVIRILDEDGEPYRVFSKKEGKGLTIITAEKQSEAKRIYIEMMDWIKDGVIKREEISQVVVKEGDVILFGTDDAVEVILGKEDLEARLKRARAVLEDAKKRGLMIRCIDARFEKGAIIEERKG
ncbi:MAG: FtsQ-type POTRA domain-containing protein [Syntrophorhabdaceae bacterium]|nr:FtsQ-type POTRA domain-containing protein [Syntrophorhabdaceae bacterium]